MKRIFMTGCLVATTIFAKAQTDSTKTDSIQVLTPVEVRATRVNEKSPFAASNISQKEINKQNLGQNLPYLLAQVPSVVTSSDDGLGVGYSSMRIRGTDITRINVTFNGIPVNDPESQGTFFVNTPDIASTASSIQIQRGVGSSTNGSGAFGASVNVYNLEQQDTAGLTVSNAYGSYNTWKHTLRASTGILKGGFQFDVRLSKISSEGYVERSFSDLKSLQLIGGWTSQNDKTNIKFNLLTGKERTGQAWNGLEVYYTGAGNFNYQDSLKALGLRKNFIGYMGDDDKGNPVYYNDQTDNYQQDYYQLFLNHRFSTSWSGNLSFYMTRGRGYYNEYKDEESFEDYGLDPFVRAVGDTSETTNLTRQLWLDNYYYGSVFSLNYLKNKTNINFGGSFTKYDAKHYGFVKWAEYGFPLDYKWYDLTAFKNDLSMYAKLQQELTAGLFAFADLQYRNVRYETNGFRKSPYEPKAVSMYNFFNPKAGLTYFINHYNNRRSKIHVSYAVANREPNRDDFEGALPDKPKHEQLQDVEAGYELSSAVFSAGVNGYYMKYKDQLIATGQINDVGASVRANVPESYRAGIELVLRARPAAWLEAGANATFSKNKIKEFTQYGWDDQQYVVLAATYKNTDIAFSANTLAGASLTFKPFSNEQRSHDFYIDIIEKYVGRQYLDNSSDKMKSINPYALTDIRLRYSFTTPRIKEISIIGMVNNLFNKQYENNGFTYYGIDEYGTAYFANGYYPQAGINWNLGLSFTF